MTISANTTPQDVSDETKGVMNLGAIPNMLLRNDGTPNGFVSEKKDYHFWLNRVCGGEGRHRL